MRSLVAALSLLASSGTALADEPASQPADVSAAVDRGLAFLVKDALAWKNEHNCVSCHHAGLVVWSMREAKQRGFAVDEPVLAELTTGDPSVDRAHAFLIQTQRDDGSWPMTSRPTKPGGEGSKSLIPITGAGSAWAVMGLARSR
ncbi:MAG: hypothetical protein WD278_19430 [Pirellulales bacterium]